MQFDFEMDGADEETTASALEHIASMIRQGFTSGQAGMAGWWSVKEMAETTAS